MTTTVAIIGTGRVGCVLGKQLTLAGYKITAVVNRDFDRAHDACTFMGCDTTLATTNLHNCGTAQIVLLTVPDDQIKLLATELQSIITFQNSTTLIHCSGIHPAAIMRLNNSAARLLSCHPLLPFASREVAFTKLHQCPWGIESDDKAAITIGKQLVDNLRGTHFTIASEKKELYHAAACITSNYLVTLLAAAQKLFQQCAIDNNEAHKLLIPLAQASLENVQQLGTQQGLTGPIVRGDIGTITKHIEALSEDDQKILTAYQLLGEHTVALAQSANRLDNDNANKIKKLFNPTAAIR